MPKYIAEFVGTFFLVLAVICAVNKDDIAVVAPIAIGATLMAMIYSVGNISKAHFNPVVTLSFFALGKCSSKDVIGYIIAQLSASVLATAIAMYVYDCHPDTAPVNMDLVKGGVAEILGTFALVWVIIFVAISKSNAGNSFFGLAIGMMVIGGAYILGDQGSMGCFNPAVALATYINGLNTGWNLIPITAANLIGAGIATGVYRQYFKNV